MHSASLSRENGNADVVQATASQAQVQQAICSTGSAIGGRAWCTPFSCASALARQVTPRPAFYNRQAPAGPPVRRIRTRAMMPGTSAAASAQTTRSTSAGPQPPAERPAVAVEGDSSSLGAAVGQPSGSQPDPGGAR
jgi:hypothetical protein